MERLEGDLLPKALVTRILFSASKESDLYKLLHSVGSMTKFRQHSELERLHRILAMILRWKSKDSLARAKKQSLTTEEVESAKIVWVKWIQQEIIYELEDSIAVMRKEQKDQIDFSRDCQVLSFMVDQVSAALRGWPTLVSSDPGSQLVLAGGKMESWYQEMESSLQGLVSLKGFC